MNLCMEIVSLNFPHKHIGVHANGWDAFIVDTPSNTFRLVDALNGDAAMVSIESCSTPSYFIRHQGFDVKVHPEEGHDLYKQDSSWKVLPGLSGDGTVTFESANFPGRAIRHQGYDLKLHNMDGSELFKQDSTFTLIEVGGPPAAPLYNMNLCMEIVSLNFPHKHIGVHANGWDAFIVDTPSNTFRLVDALNGDAAMVSIESCSTPGYFIRHQGFDVKVHPEEGHDLYKQDSSWKVLPGLSGDGTVTFESANFP